MITVYHCTTPGNALAILRDGFRESVPAVGGPSCVWLSDEPKGWEIRGKGNAVLMIDLEGLA